MMGLDRELGSVIIAWLLENGLQILLIIITALIVHRFANIFIEKAIRRAIIPSRFISREAERKREDTLIRIFSTVTSVVTLILAFIMILSEFGVNTGALLAGLGVVGVAVGFGAQYMIKDFISGFFIILENQYRVGDVVCFDKTCGLVEDINLRMTVLRDLDGAVHHVPNGEIKISSNLSKTFANVNVDIAVAYSSDLEKVIKVINNVGNDLAEDPEWKERIRKAPQFLRVNDFADSGIIVKILGETEPLQQWDVAGEFRKRLKIAFDKEKIEIPFPQRVVHLVK